MLKRVGERLVRTSQPVCTAVATHPCAFRLVLVDTHDMNVYTVESLEREKIEACKGVDLFSERFPEAPVRSAEVEPMCIIAMKPVGDSMVTAGAILVPKKLINLITSEHELAGVLAHEFAHQICGHAHSTQARVNAKYMGTTLEVFGILAALAVGVNPGTTIVPQIDSYKPLIEDQYKRYNRAEELEADFIGAFLVARAGYNLDRAVKVWTQLLKNQFDIEALPKNRHLFADTYPPAVDRIVMWQKTASMLHSSPEALPPKKCMVQKY